MVPSSIEVEIHSRKACVVTLHGEHDTATRDGVTLALALARDYTHLLVDLTPCTFLDATVINALLTAAKRMRAAGANLELAVRPMHSVRRTLELCGALQQIPAHESRSAGIAAISAAARIETHPRPVSLKAVSAEIDHFQDRGAGGRKRPSAKRGGVTVIRAHVADATSDELDAARERERRRAA